MEIDSGNINHNALRLIEEVSDDFYDFVGREDCEKWCLVTLAEIRGITLMADAMKEVLRT